MIPNERTKRKSKNVDSRLLISGMTTGGGGFPIKDFGNDGKGGDFGNDEWGGWIPDY